MPDGNGLDLVEEIHDGDPGPRIPTLVLTASLDTSVAGRAIEAGALQAGFDAGDRRCDKEADRRRTLRGMSTPPDR
jgi:CheY-like chemotaxis protein